MRKLYLAPFAYTLLILASSVASPAQSPSGLSRQFRRDGVESVNAIEEWRNILTYAIRNGYPVAGDWVSTYDEKAAEALRLASVSAANDSDRATLDLLSNQYNNVERWSDNLVAARTSLDAELAIAPDEIYNDPLFQQISQCQRELSEVLVNGSFRNAPVCH